MDKPKKSASKPGMVKPAKIIRVKSRMSQVEADVSKALDGESVSELLACMTPEDQAMFNRIAADIRQHGTSAELDDLWKIDYIRKPPTITEFITDDYWLGRVLRKSEDSEGLFPIWKTVLERDFDLDSRLNNIVLTGSLGIGKTWLTCAIFLYRFTCARLLRNPQAFFNLSKGSSIFYVLLSVTKSAVADTAFGDIKNFMANSAFFIEECGFDPSANYGSMKICLGNNMHISAGSKGWHVIGRNAMGIALDEGNFRNEADPDTSAYKLYDEVRTRIQNRFQRIQGFLPAISILSSSARDETSFTERVITDINRANDPKTQRVYRYAVYEVRADQLRLGPEWFKVAHGIRSTAPVILAGVYDKDGKPLRGTPGYEQAPEGAQVTLVPMFYRDAFERNIKSNLQSVCGISTGGSDRWFSSITDVEACYALAAQDGVVNPARLDALPISDEDDKEIWDYLDHRQFLTRNAGAIQPMRHPEAKRFAHIDLATQTMAGVAICHSVGSALVDGLVKDGRVYSEYRVVVEYDFILTITAGKNRPISIEKIQKFFFWLRMQCGYNFGRITADQFNSAMPLQMMAARGFETSQLSVDRKKDQYLAWRNAFEEHRIRPYRQYWLDREIRTLVDTGSKVDHTSDSSKDTCDGACGAYWNCIADIRSATPSYSGASSLYMDDDAVDVDRAPPPIWFDVGGTGSTSRSFEG